MNRDTFRIYENWLFTLLHIDLLLILMLILSFENQNDVHLFVNRLNVRGEFQNMSFYRSCTF